MKKVEPILVKVHHYGKITIPAHLRQLYGIREGATLRVYATDTGILFEVYDTEKLS